MPPRKFGMAGNRSYINKAVVCHLFATVWECPTVCPTLGSGRVTYGGLHDQNPHRNVAVLLSGRLCHGDRDRGCQPDHLRTSEGNKKGPAAMRSGPFPWGVVNESSFKPVIIKTTVPSRESLRRDDASAICQASTPSTASPVVANQMDDRRTRRSRPLSLQTIAD